MDIYIYVHIRIYIYTYVTLIYSYLLTNLYFWMNNVATSSGHEPSWPTLIPTWLVSDLKVDIDGMWSHN